MRFRLVVGGESHEIEAERGAQGVRVRVDGAEYRTRPRRSGDEFTVQIGAKAHQVRFEGVAALVDGARHSIGISGIQDERSSQTQDSASPEHGSLQVRAPMPGRVVRVFVRVGERVKRGQTLVVLEAMKMQNEIPAPRDGVVRAVDVIEGESIIADRVVAVIEAR